MGEMSNAYRIVVGKYEKKRRRERTGRRMEGNSRMDPNETGWKVEDWMHLVRLGTSGGLS